MVKIGPLVTKLWPCKVNHHLVNQFLPLCTGFRTYVKTAYLHINSRRFFVHKEKRAPLFARYTALDFVKKYQSDPRSALVIIDPNRTQQLYSIQATVVRDDLLRGDGGRKGVKG